MCVHAAYLLCAQAYYTLINSVQVRALGDLDSARRSITKAKSAYSNAVDKSISEIAVVTGSVQATIGDARMQGGKSLSFSLVDSNGAMFLSRGHRGDADHMIYVHGICKMPKGQW